MRFNKVVWPSDAFPHDWLDFIYKIHFIRREEPFYEGDRAPQKYLLCTLVREASFVNGTWPFSKIIAVLVGLPHNSDLYVSVLNPREKLLI